MFLLLFITSMVAVTMETDQTPKGHLKPIGSHRPSDGHIEILTTVPQPIEFWQKYVSNGEPVLLRGAAEHSPGQKLWTDTYLLENYGKFKVKVESKFEKYDVPVGEFGIGQESIKNFIGRYIDDDIYVVSQLPDPMTKDVAVPPCILGGTFRKHISEADLWMSSGGTKSLLHRDADDALNCLFNGTKDWIMIHPRDEKNIPIAKEAFEAFGGFSVLDPDKVDLLKHPQFVNVPWKFVNVKAGDCLFIPKGYWHQVTSGGAKNVAVSLLFGRVDKFEPLNCDKTDFGFEPLSEVGTVWTYDGFGVQSMGNDSPYRLNETIQEMCVQSLQHRITLEDIIQSFLMEHLQSEEVRNVVFKDAVDTYEQYVENFAIQLIGILGDTDHKGYVTCDEIQNISLDKLKDFAALISMDPGNTDDKEYYTFSKKTIEVFLLELADEIENTYSLSIDIEKLSNKYTNMGGTSQVARIIFGILDVDSDSTVTVKEIKNNIEQVLQLFGRLHVFGGGEVMDWVEFDFNTNEQHINEIPDIPEHNKDEL